MARSTPTQWTRLIRFRAQEDHQIYFGQPIDHNLDVGQAFANRQPIRVAVLSTSAPEASIELLAAGYPNSSNIKTVADLLAPLTRTQVGTIRALGANYIQPNQDPHAARTNRPPIPILFYKPLSTLVGPNQAIKVPQVAQDETDYEVELLVVLGRDAKDVSVESALDYVVGYSLANDVSARKRMFAVPQWGLGKSFDTFLPIGPVIVSSHTIPDPESVSLTTQVNGTTYQSGVTADHLWSVKETIAQLSAGTTLEAGSIISMGTPPGEGFKRSPPIFLQHGDLVSVGGSHGLGTLINPVVGLGTAPTAAKL